MDLDRLPYFLLVGFLCFSSISFSFSYSSRAADLVGQISVNLSMYVNILND